MVFGVGGVGLNIVQAAYMVSSNPIIGIDIHKKKLKMGQEFGLTHGFLADERNLEKKIYDIVGPHGVDVVIETTGKSEVIEKAYNITSSKGRTILVGVPNKNISIYSLPLHFDKIITGSHGGNSIPDIDIPRYINLILRNKMTLDGLITHEFDLDNNIY